MPSAVARKQARRQALNRPLDPDRLVFVDEIWIKINVARYGDPQAWLADVLARIADTPQTRLHELLPWHWKDDRFHALAAWNAVLFGGVRYLCFDDLRSQAAASWAILRSYRL